MGSGDCAQPLGGMGHVTKAVVFLADGASRGTSEHGGGQVDGRYDDSRHWNLTHCMARVAIEEA
jgi:hypothetical protein